MSRKADREDQRIAREAIKKYGEKYNVSCDIANEYGSASDEEYEDASEDKPTSPTPGGKYAGPSTRDGQKTLHEADRQWTAMESEDAYEALSTGLATLQTDSYLNVRRNALLDLQ